MSAGTEQRTGRGGHPDYRGLSLWFDSLPEQVVRRPALDRDIEVDVAIVGAGFTGLWTAYYLSKEAPNLDIAVVEAQTAGFGASGRNGGWCSALFAAARERVAKAAGRQAAVELQRALFDTVDEVGRVAAREAIDCHYAKGGTLTLARSVAQEQRLRAYVGHERAWGFGADDVSWLSASQAAGRVAASDVRGGVYSPHCAALHPARLARGLADVVAARRRVTLYEGTPATVIAPHRVYTPGGKVRARTVVRATEAYTATLRGHTRALLPLYSLMIATEPLPAELWRSLQWRLRETVADGRHLIVYAQRTADGRIAFGGRGAPYHFGSRVSPAYDREPAVFAELQRALVEMFPETAGAQITHRWGGPLAAPRDWFSSVCYDRAAGIATAGGYVGDGVATSNLAGRTLADLVLDRDTELTRLPWVGHRSRRWEPEPLRWLGVNAGLRLMTGADRAEARTGRPSLRARLTNAYLGH